MKDTALRLISGDLNNGVELIVELCKVFSAGNYFV